VSRWPFVIAAVVVVLAAVGIAGLPIAEERIAEAIKARVAQRPGLKIASVQVSLLQRRVVASELTLVTGPDGTLRLGRADVRGLGWPLSELLAGRTPFTSWTWGDPLQVERIEIDDFEFVHAIEGEWRAAKLIAEGVDLPRHEQPAEARPWGVVRQAIAFGHLTVRRLEERDASYQPPDEFGMALKLKTLVVDGLARGRAESFTVAGAELRDYATRPSPWLSVGDLTMRALDLSLPIARLSDPEWTSGMPLGRVWFDRVTMDGLGGDVLSELALAVGRVSFESTREGKRAIGRTKVESIALKPQGLNPDTVQMYALLTALGLREVTASLDCVGGEDRVTNEFALERCRLVAPGLAELEFSFKFINADEAFWSAMDGGDAFQIFSSTIGLGAARLVVRDLSLLDRLVKLSATSRGISPAEARVGMAREVRRYQPTDVLITEEVTKLADVIARFVEQGGTLTVEARPDPPITLDDTRVFWGSGPGPDIVQMFGVTATHRRN
jgi:hypothetical protein